MTRLQWSAWACVAAGLAAAGGCPAPPPADTDPVSAKITLTADSGPPPLSVLASGAQSVSTSGTINSYTWDFAGLKSASGVNATYTFNNPGFYRVTLTVTDDAGATGTAVADVRVQGATPTAVATANTLEGFAPLLVSFDGRASSAPDDVIRDYYWDFDDGSTSRLAAPQHVFQREGTYIVRLRAVTGGGVEDETTITVNVTGNRSASLAFYGTQFATLPLSTQAPIGAFTFTTWMHPYSGGGGTVVQFGTPELAIGALVTDGQIEVASGATISASASGLSSGWRHLAVTRTDAGLVTIYLNGAVIGSGTLTGDLSVDRLILGSGFEGGLAQASFWNIALTAQDVADLVTTQPTGSEAGLLGFWAMNAGSGQSLPNRLTNGAAGVRGGSAAEEASDPLWTTDRP